MSTASADIFFGIYIGSDDDDEIPEVIKEEKVPGKAPVQVVMGGPFEYGPLDYSLAVKASLTSADWDGNPFSLMDQPIMTKAGTPDVGAWAATLQEWCDKLGIPWDKVMEANPRGPRWLMVLSTG